MLFEVVAKCGHVGKNLFTEKIFPVVAESATAAASMVRWFPRVKHHHPDAIRSVKAIGHDRYNELVESKQSDMYFRCHSRQEQDRLCLHLEIFEEITSDEADKKRESSRRPVYAGKQKIRNPKRYFNSYLDYYGNEDDVA